jgi:RimJ/RimL family protein N-acetyltransferase
MSSPTVSLRPIVPSDRAALAALFDRLSPESRYRRFLGPKKVLLARELSYLTEVDHLTHSAVVAVDAASGELVGVARYAVGRDGVPDFAVAVDDAWHGQGLGSALSRVVIARAVENGYARMTASTLWDNDPARTLLARLGFQPEGVSRGVMELGLELSSAQVNRGSVGRWSSVS